MQVEIRPVAKPRSFDSVKFTQKDWEAAAKKGALVVDGATALENIRNSKGLYEFVPEKKIKLEVEAKAPSEMTALEIAAELTAHGKPPQKKMKRATAEAFILELREKAAGMIIEDDEDEGEDNE